MLLMKNEQMNDRQSQLNCENVTDGNRNNKRTVTIFKVLPRKLENILSAIAFWGIKQAFLD